MNRVLLILFLCVVCFTSCKKGYDPVADERTQADIDQKIIEDYVAATPGLGAKIKQIDSAGIKTGVYYVEERAGTGNAIFTNSTRITIDYTSRILTTGEVFAQSNNFHPSFTLGEVLRAWKLGIPYAKKGGKIRIIAASRYGYGPYDQPEIKLPANSVVDFDIELLDVTN
ncbi:FKBP-type peptidyl-prolyl cis-trans isomerase [Mucilaginibacter lutimaris]|uniref:Peptidyl-prolyl cis-trans isomerase n=1 Tax=Mucilaginibacter lutimaris TaxID=931629 RepID=A0ABW2ZHF3_9SPHI